MIKRLFSIFTESTQSFHGQETGEKVVLILRRHIFTVIVPLIVMAIAGLVPIILWEVLRAQIGFYKLVDLFLFISSLWYLLLWLSIFYFLTMYSLNTVIVTDRRIIENEQHAFFNRKVSELHTYRVQDVSAHTSGIIETFLNFGDIVVQTAASERQFVFHSISHPEEIKNIIMQVVAAHQSKMGLA